MKKFLTVLICIAIVFSFVACNSNNNATNESGNSQENNSDAIFTQTVNNTIVANDGTEYTFVGIEYQVHCFGEWDFIGHVKGEKKTFGHLTEEIKTGMYSVNGNQDILGRFFPDNEFPAVYVKKGLLKTEVSLDNCIRFEFIKISLFDDAKTTISKKGITECKQFLSEIKSGQKAEEAGLYNLVKQPDGRLKNCYVYGYVCGIVQEDVNIVIPLEVMSFDDKAYSITIDNTQYVLPKEWIDKLTSE